MSKIYDVVELLDTGEIEKETPIQTQIKLHGETTSLLEDLVDDDSTEHLQENIINKRRLQQFKEKYTKELLNIIREQDFEYGLDSQADWFIRKLFKTNEAVTKEWLNLVFINYFDDTRVIIGLLQIIAHMEYFEIYPQGPTMALAALSHTTLEVRECGIRAFENWGTIGSLNVLKSIMCPEKWLQEYVEQVIVDLEEELEVNVSAR